MSYFTDFSKIDKRKYYFDERTADLAVQYFEENIRHVEGELAGELLKLEKWQRDKIIRPIFGWKNKETGYRKYTAAYIEIPKKNGKTFIAAGFAAIFLDIDPEGGSQIFACASTRDQAKLSFNACSAIIGKSDRLSKMCTVYRNSIVSGDKVFKPLSRDSKAQEGINVQLGIVDELHVHPNGDVVENLEKSTAARRQPLILTITTAGADLESFGFERHEYAVKVATGVIDDDSLLVCIYCADKGDDIYSEKTWKKANPNYEVSVKKDYFEREIRKARASPAAENSFKRYHLNIWTNVKDQWISDYVYQASAWDFDISKLEGQKCFGGLDLASTTDITALSLVFPQDDGKFISLNWFWLPEEKGINSVDERRNRSYPTWIRDGFIEETPGNVTDYDYLIQRILELSELYKIEAIAIDPHNANSTRIILKDMGIVVHKFRQGFLSMSYPTKQLEALILSKKFNHLGHPVLRWMMSNSVVDYDKTANIKIVRDKRHQKVDGIISNIMALGIGLDPSNLEQSSYLGDNGGDLMTL